MKKAQTPTEIEREQLKADPYHCECFRCTITPTSDTPFTWTKRPRCPRCVDRPGRCTACGSPKRCPNCNCPEWDQERKNAARTPEQRARASASAKKRWKEAREAATK